MNCSDEDVFNDSDVDSDIEDFWCSRCAMRSEVNSRMWGKWGGRARPIIAPAMCRMMEMTRRLDEVNWYLAINFCLVYTSCWRWRRMRSTRSTGAPDMDFVLNDGLTFEEGLRTLA